MRSTGKSRLILIGVVIAVVVSVTVIVLRSRRTGHVRIKDILSVYRTKTDAEYGGITITYPHDGTLFPPEIVPPTVQWSDSSTQCDAWLVRVEFGGGEAPIHVLSRAAQWTPTSAQWEAIKRQSRDYRARIVILGVRDSRSVEIYSGGHVTIGTSRDAVGAPLFYREVNLPFIDAVKDPSRIRWRFGSIAATPPPVVLENLPVCGNCHSFSQSGRTLAMDVDYANSKGSYVITPVKETMTLATSNVITWNDYRKEDGEQTFGLLSQISPDGRYVVSTVKDKSVFVPQPDLAFSQLFFPIRGILCIYDRQRGTFSALPGADDPSLVQSNPTWSPDGRHIVFARSCAYNLEHTEGQGKVLLTRAECKEFTEDGKPFLFDLYRIPFNAGQGGTPEPIAGASNNGMSNFFARYSPDGCWIVFCKARSYMLLQPDSELYIIPADGGPARRLRCNTSRMNSWHSWSPNGKWLVFASKAFSDYTQLCLTHIDAQGNSTPPVLLAHLTAPDRAANIPEFVNAPPTAIGKIHEQFLNDYSFVRAGDEFF
ncbi:MAG: PD40 domain-containing protein, partial [Phycisphaerales bacterium]